MKKTLRYLFVLLCIQTGIAQNIVGKVIDSKTKESIPFANMMLNGTESLVSNEEGYFTLSESKISDGSVLTVSYLGYVSRQITIGELKNRNNTVALEQGIFALDDLNVSNVKPDANSIMASVNRNLAKNYKAAGNVSKDMLFVREIAGFTPKQIDVEITKSTGFKKDGLKSANADLTAFTSRFVSNPPKVYTDMLCNYYVDHSDTGNPAVKKLEVLKAIKLRDENRSASLDDLQESATRVVLKHLDTMKYYRIKSGLIGSRDTISMRKNFKSKKKKDTPSALTASKSNLDSFYADNNFAGETKLDFVTHPEWYEYTYEGAIYSAENEFVYVLKFKPKKSKANYEGKIYVTENDFAVVKADYNLAKGKTMGGINMKWILGIKASMNVSKGTVIYKQNPSGNGYFLQYASVESGNYFYLHRPVKFIELSEEDNDVVAFDIKIEGNQRKKVELLNITHSETTETTLANVSEPEFTYQRLKRYDPAIWKDYSTIEPLAEMKQYTAE